VSKAVFKTKKMEFGERFARGKGAKKCAKGDGDDNDEDNEDDEKGGNFDNIDED
jgi:hypothetical protein